MGISLGSLFRKNLSSFMDGRYDFLREKRGGHGHRCYVDGLSHAEKQVVDKMAFGLSYKEYFIFNNVIIPRKNGLTSQIDHIVVSKYGVFVIESKDYSGWVFGGENDHVWTQTLPAKRHNKHTFQNPMRQNYGHLKMLEERLSIPIDHFYNLVVFSERCVFKTPRIDNVLYLSELVGHIKQHQEEKIDIDTIVRIIGKLFFMCQSVDTTAEQHIQNVRKGLSQKTV